MQSVGKPVRNLYSIKVNTILPRKPSKVSVNTMQRRESKTYLMRYADKEVSYYVIHRDKFCVTCGTNEGLTNSHLFKRGRIPLRFDLENCNCQCATCNGLHNTDQRPYENWFIRKFGQRKFDELQVGSWGLAKFTTGELREIIIFMQNLNKQFS